MNNFQGYDYRTYNIYNSLVSPSTVHVTGSSLSLFFQRHLFQRVVSMFKWTIPENWPESYFLNVLYMSGFISVVNTNKYGVIPQACTLTGYDVFYQPSHIVLNNPNINSASPIPIGVTCELIKLSIDFQGIFDLVSFYGDQLALVAEALGTNLVNSKLSYLFVAPNQATAQSYKALYDKISRGEPAVFADSKIQTVDGKMPQWNFFQQDLAQNHIAPELLEEITTIIRIFDNEVGIPTPPDKRERLITSEVASSTYESISKACLWMDCLKRSVNKVNKMFNLDITVDWRYHFMGGDSNDSMALLDGNSPNIS